ncbi:MAG: SAP domain-containing protein [Desulfuromonas sp.]|nr:SAP domain-containing protein [Desulfuromonas sp.]
MKMIEVKALAKQRGVKPGKMKKQELIRSLQLAEGNPQCFNTGISTECGQEDCLWRSDCK